MNDLEKRSFYSFLGLYIISSFFFVAFVGFWYYAAQKQALENEMHYRLEHIADQKAGAIVMAAMRNSPMDPISIPQDMNLALIDTQGHVREGHLSHPDMPLEPGYFTLGDDHILISDAPREHLNIAYIVVQSNRLKQKLTALKQKVWIMTGISFGIMIIIAWILSRLFMRPVHERILQIERFINDITHELNTPITSLTMSTNQALHTGHCNHKTLNNISISTRQLYDIYRSLTYLNFNHSEEISEPLDVKDVLQKSMDYYRPLAEMKRIEFAATMEATDHVIPRAQLTLLLGNLIGNAIKYSPPNSTITISLVERVLKIMDHGIGIDPQKQKMIFKKFHRGTEYSGGFGVGLNIVKSICDEHRIRIELDSLPDEGTEFRLYF